MAEAPSARAGPRGRAPMPLPSSFPPAASAAAGRRAERRAIGRAWQQGAAPRAAAGPWQEAAGPGRPSSRPLPAARSARTWPAAAGRHQVRGGGVRGCDAVRRREVRRGESGGSGAAVVPLPPGSARGFSSVRQRCGARSAASRSVGGAGRFDARSRGARGWRCRR